MSRIYFEGWIYFSSRSPVTQPIYQERLCDMPESDLEAEGGLWASGQEFIDLFGGNPNRVVWVVRFELVQVIN